MEGEYSQAVLTPDLQINAVWILVCTGFIFFMEAGFFLLEAGGQRKKNTSHIIFINLMSACMALLSWWLTGYGFAFGQNKNHFISGDGRAFASSKLEDYEAEKYLEFVFQFAFCTTTTSIVSGSLAERVNVHVFLGYCWFLAGFVYPTVVAWVWCPGGWLYERGYHDLAGTSVIHITGGFGGMIGAIVLGPRLLKQKRVQNIDREKLCQEKEYLNVLKTIDSEEDRIIFRKWFLLQLDEEIKPCNDTYMALGTTILFVAWLFFNGGSVYSMQTPRQNSAAKTVMNTVLGGAVGGLFTVYLKPLILRTHTPTSRFSVGDLCNGILVGCVAVTGACDRCENWAAVIIGFFAALFYILGVFTGQKLGIDDPVDAFCVHGFGGLCGIISVAFFDNQHGLIYEREDRGKFLGFQLAGMCAIFGWTCVMSFLYFIPFKLFKVDRVSDSMELMGFDIGEMGAMSKKLMRKIRQEVMITTQTDGKFSNDDKLMATQTNLMGSERHHKKDSYDSRHASNQVHIVNVEDSDREKDFNERKHGDKPVKVDTVQRNHHV